MTGITALSKEEKEHTAEFLLTHPVSRLRILAEKLLSVYLRILILNLAVTFITAAGILLIDEKVTTQIITLFFSYLLSQLEIASITFGISAFIKNGAAGIGLSAAAVFYFLNILANLSDRLHFLKAFTPFGYTDSADILSLGRIDSGYLTCGICLAFLGIAAAFSHYPRKDIHA